MINIAMNHSKSNQAHQVYVRVIGNNVFYRTVERFIFKKRTVFYGIVNPQKILKYNSARTQINMTHFTVSDLTFRQTYRLSGGDKQSVWVRKPEVVKIYRISTSNGITRIVLGYPPAIKNAKLYRVRFLSNTQHLANFMLNF